MNGWEWAGCGYLAGAALGLILVLVGEVVSSARKKVGMPAEFSNAWIHAGGILILWPFLLLMLVALLPFTAARAGVVAWYRRHKVVVEVVIPDGVKTIPVDTRYPRVWLNGPADAQVALTNRPPEGLTVQQVLRRERSARWPRRTLPLAVVLPGGAVETFTLNRREPRVWVTSDKVVTVSGCGIRVTGTPEVSRG
jgi:hypothetical protein